MFSFARQKRPFTLIERYLLLRLLFIFVLIWSLVELSKEVEKRNKIHDWETKRDDLNEKLDNCQDKLRLVKRDENPPESKAADDLLAAAKVRNEFIIQLLLIFL